MRRAVAVFLLLLAIVACGSGRSQAASGAALGVATGLAAFDARAKQAFARSEIQAAEDGRFRPEAARLSHLRLPQHASETLDLGTGANVSVRMKDARPAKAENVEGHVVYADVFPDADAIFTADRGEIEEWLLLRSPSAPTRFTYAVTAAHESRATIEDDGSVTFRDADDSGVLWLPQPYAVDASGTRRVATWSFTSEAHDELALQLDTRGLAYPILLDPSYVVWLWTEEKGLTGRMGASLAYDTARGKAILFGGLSATKFSNETWSWNGAAWTREVPAHSPPPRAHGVMAYDAKRDRIVLFGGQSPVLGALDDTWTWNGVDWTKYEGGTSPGFLVGSAGAYDAVREVFVIFGGTLVTGALSNQTWIWNGTAWTRAFPATVPAGRVFAAMTFDSDRGQVVMAGGLTTRAIAETYTWNGTNWTRRADMPFTLNSPSLAHLPSAHASILYGGADANASRTTLSWDGTAWTTLVLPTYPRERYAASMALDSTSGRLLMFGGIVNEVALRDTHTFDGTAWTDVSTGPNALQDSACAYDAARGKVLLFGGYSGTGRIDRTWLWDGAWSAGVSAVHPPQTTSARAVYDTARAEVVLFGGYADLSATTSGSSDATWRWDGQWHEATPATKPPARYGHAMSYDSVRSQVVLFGGYDDVAVLGDTWLWNGVTWARATPATSPSARTRASMAYDRKRDRTVLFGGFDSEARSDTWEWNGTTWSRIDALTYPDARYSVAMTYDVDRQRIVLVGGAGNGFTYGDHYSFDGTTWEVHFGPRFPAFRSSAALVNHEARHRLLLFGGDTGPSQRDDTWTAYRLGEACATDEECPGAYCTDGVCCERKTCGTCGSCNGNFVGTCIQVQNREDPDTCAIANGKSCSAGGVCKTALGLEAASASECASGFLVDGVCCETATCGPCQTCNAATKERPGFAGKCGAAKSGTEPKNDCDEESTVACGRTGACDGLGRCATERVALRCGEARCDGNRAVGQICNGTGMCILDTAGADCSPYSCAAGSCAITCANDAECVSTHRCNSGVCEQRQSARCIDESTIETPDGTRQACGAYRCRDTACITRCESLADCIYPNQCDDSGQCISFSADPAPPSDGCNMGPRTKTNAWLYLVFGAAWLARRVRRARSSAAAMCLLGTATVASITHEPVERESAVVQMLAQAEHDARARHAFHASSITSRGAEGSADISNARVRFPAEASRAVAWGAEAHGVRLSLAGANPSPLSVSRGIGVYENVMDDVDLAVTAAGDEVEEWLWLRSNAAPTMYSYRVAFDETVIDAKTEQGSLVVRDADGRTRMVVAPPYAIDAGGTRREAQLAFHAPDRLDVSFDASGLRYPVLLDPSFTLWEWNFIPVFPSRSGGAGAFDESRGKLVVFGGAGTQATTVSRTWEWNGVEWSVVATAHSPRARYEGTMTYDAERRRVVLFGGQADSGAYYDDTWTYDGVDWTEHAPAVHPDWRAWARMAYDPIRKNVVLFGGAASTLRPGTWLWDGAAWTLAAPTTTPPLRHSHLLAYDPLSSRVLLFGGYVGTGWRNDTWAWDGAQWTSLNPVARPSQRITQGALSAVGGPLVIFGGYGPSGALADTWEWNGTNWLTRSPATSPPARDSAVAALDTARGELIVTSGYGAARLRDMWAYNGVTWVDRTTLPPSAVSGMLVHDEKRNKLVFQGGLDNGITPIGSTWLWDRGRWEKGPTTSSRVHFASTYDSVNEEIVTFGGFRRLMPVEFSDDTMTWDGTTWTTRSPAVKPAARGTSTLAYDRIRQEAVMYGGGMPGKAATNETWVWRSADRNWLRKMPAHSPPALGDHASIFDREHGYVVVFGGVRDDYTTSDETWLWDGTDWTQHVGTGRPPARAKPGFTWDAERKVGHLYAGAGDEGRLNDMWVWDGAWTRALVGVTLNGRGNPYFVSSSVTGELFLMSGLSATSLFDETWIGRSLGASCTTNAECPSSRFCTDGVCCENAVCSECETCAGSLPGRCSRRYNQEDPDTCPTSEGKRCSGGGVCRKALGVPATAGSECASGFVVDGVCCTTSMCGACQTCDIDKKEFREYAGECGATRAGLDTRDDCQDEGATSCGRTGTCDGRGACAQYSSETLCGPSVCDGTRSNGRRCNGGGVCREVSSDRDCAPYVCTTGDCVKECTTDDQCVSTHRCESGRCVSRAGGSCDGDHTIHTPEGAAIDCGVFKCEGAACRTRCTSVADCVFPAQCGLDGKCAAFTEPPAEEGGCALAASAASPQQAGWQGVRWLVFLAAIGAFSRSRRRAVRS